MPLTRGTRLGPYEVLASLGAGGMGEVYRARDTRLRREVAIKILGARHAVSPKARDRLLREARTASALNHPNIVALHDIGSEDGRDFLVMELVRGKTLEQVAGNRGLAIADVVKYAIPISDALARAHAAGILHRDLKPSNIMVTEDGVPKILDFGLAQLAEPEPISEEDATRTLHERVAPEEKGHIAGTPGYMSPEQAEGKKLDARSDIFSFGAVLYELVTGRRAFRGDSTASTLAAVLRHQPDAPSQIAPNVPRELDRIIQRCLRKDPNRRFHSMNDVKVELEEVKEESESGMSAATATAVPRRRRWMWVGAGLAAALAFVAVGVRFVLTSRTPPPSRPVPLTALQGDEHTPDFSPDGSQVVFSWDEQEGRHLYVKLIGSPGQLQITRGDGMEGYPAWSPDGRWIAFQRYKAGEFQVMLVSPIGGTERKVGNHPCDGPFSWSNDSQWLACATPGDSSRLILARAEGGETRRLTSPKPSESDGSPAFSPDDSRMLFVRCAGQYDCDLYLLELNADVSPRGEPRRVTNEHFGGTGSGTWTADGRTAIWGASTGMQLGHPTLYRVPVEHAGPIEPLLYAGMAMYPAVSRSRNRLAYVRWVQTFRLERSDGHTTKRDPVSSTETDYGARFSPDGKRIALESNRSGTQEIWAANTDGSAPVQLTSFGRHSGSPAWSPDGRWLAFDSLGTGGRRDIWVVDAGGGTPRQLTRGPRSSNIPSFSRDGKWVYFNSERTGRPEIFRIPFEGGAAVQLTHNGGQVAQESPDGKSVYYTKSGTLWRVPVDGGAEQSTGIKVYFRAYQVVSEGIYFVAQTINRNHRSHAIRFYDFARRAEQTVQDLGGLVYGASSLAVSPDRKWFVYTLIEGTGADLMLVENFR